ncbi:MAG: hypothetical protein C0497_03790 [Gemmatimonas sp.]|nr:hypothetical protein [Gemmatimonas sp.]
MVGSARYPAEEVPRVVSGLLAKECMRRQVVGTATLVGLCMLAQGLPVRAQAPTSGPGARITKVEVAPRGATGTTVEFFWHGTPPVAHDSVVADGLLLTFERTRTLLAPPVQVVRRGSVNWLAFVPAGTSLLVRLNLSVSLREDYEFTRSDSSVILHVPGAVVPGDGWTAAEAPHFERVPAPTPMVVAAAPQRTVVSPDPGPDSVPPPPLPMVRVPPALQPTTGPATKPAMSKSSRAAAAARAPARDPHASAPSADATARADSGYRVRASNPAAVGHDSGQIRETPARGASVERKQLVLEQAALRRARAQTDSLRHAAEREVAALLATRDSLVRAAASRDSAAAVRRQQQADSALSVLREQATALGHVVTDSIRRAAQSADSAAKASALAPDLRPVSFSFKATPILQVIESFAVASGRSIIAGQELGDKVITAEIVDQPWPLALETIMRANGAIARRLPSGMLQIDATTALAKGETTDPLETRTVKLSYVKGDSIASSMLQTMATSRGKVVADPASNSVLLTDVPDAIARMEKAIASVDKPAKQVIIQARVFYVAKTDLNALGFSYDLKDTRGTGFSDLVPMPGAGNGSAGSAASTTTANQAPSVSLTHTTLAGSGNASYRVASPSIRMLATLASVNSRFVLASFFEALTQLDLARTQASPSVLVQDNQLGDVLVGEEVPIRVLDAGGLGGVNNSGGSGNGGRARTGGGNLAQPLATVTFKQVGVKLKAKPHVTDNGQIYLEVEAEESSANTSSPDIGLSFSTRKVSTKTTVRDGESVAIGGLTQQSQSRSKVGIPILSRLPWIGRLFSNETVSSLQRDMVIVVTPRIVPIAADSKPAEVR